MSLQRFVRSLSTLSLVALLSLAACSGEILPGHDSRLLPDDVTGPDGLPPPEQQAQPELTGDPATDCGAGYAPGHAMIHRLANTEYNNTVRDLLFTQSRPADTFASSSIGSSGFSTQSDVLVISDQLVGDYVEAAQKLADEALASRGVTGGAWAKLTGCAAAVAAPDAACAREVVKAFAERAFRRPIDEPTHAALMNVLAGEATFADGFHDVIVAVLIDARFLFNAVAHPSPDDPSVVAPLDGWELASRLSYFLWQSMPDAALMELAAQGALASSEVLAAQVKRMLADPKALDFATTWRRDWARLTLLDGPDGYGGLSGELSRDLRQQAQLMVEDVVKRDASLLELVTTDHTFVNANVASFYGWNMPEVTSSAFVRVQSPDENRRGMLTQAPLMLTVGGGESYTHPVQRGRWVMDSLLCQPPGAPPPGVPSLPSPTSSTATIRERLEAHVSQPACRGCHATMDVYGLGLENFDMQGRWRDTYAELGGVAIDATGTLPDGRSFKTPKELVALLGADPAVRSCLTKKMLSLALARPVTSADDYCVARSLAQHAKPASTLSELIVQVVRSRQFLQQAGATP